MVPGEGLEPTRSYLQRILNPSRLPVPPFRQKVAFLLYKKTYKKARARAGSIKNEIERVMEGSIKIELKNSYVT